MKKIVYHGAFIEILGRKVEYLWLGNTIIYTIVKHSVCNKFVGKFCLTSLRGSKEYFCCQCKYAKHIENICG